MVDPVLDFTDRISIGIRAGESHFREFKSALDGPPGNKVPREVRAIKRDIGETLVAFANAGGGELFVGVEDDGTITGVPHSAEKINEILKAPLSQVHPDTELHSPVIRQLDHMGKIILYFAVEKGTQYVHITSDGKCLQRKDRQSVPVPSEQIRFERQEQISREYDRQFVDGATIADLNHKVLDTIIKEIAPGMSHEMCLQLLGLAEYTPGGIKLRKAALLLFADKIQRWHPRCEIRVLKIKGTEIKTGREFNVIHDEICTDNIFGLAANGWDLIRPFLVETKFIANSLFKTNVMYPEDACREAVINAIAHRDYSIEGRNIEIFVYDDRMEVRSPGSLLSTVSLQSLKSLTGVHQSRNALVARVLKEAGYMREMGEGIRRIYALMKASDLVLPELVATRDYFAVVLQHRSVFSTHDQAWIDEYEDFNLTREEKLIVVMGRKGDLISPQQIRDALSIVDTEDYRIIVTQLQSKGIFTTALSKAKARSIAAHGRLLQRQVGRFAIRPPQECKQFLSSLLSVLMQIVDEGFVGNQVLQKVIDSLPQNNPYKTSTTYLLSSLRSLGIVDESRTLTAKYQGLAQLKSLVGKVVEKAERQSNVNTEATSEGKTNVLKDAWKQGKMDISSEVTNYNNKIFVSNLRYDTTASVLWELFSVCGDVLDVHLLKDRFTQRNNGLAIVEFGALKSVQQAIDMYNEREVSGRRIYVQRHKNSVQAN